MSTPDLFEAGILPIYAMVNGAVESRIVSKRKHSLYTIMSVPVRSAVCQQRCTGTFGLILRMGLYRCVLLCRD
jgi:hypothetical protein